MVRQLGRADSKGSSGGSGSSGTKTQKKTAVSSESAKSTTIEQCRCGEPDCNLSTIEENDACLQCAYCFDYVLLRCLGSDSGVVYDFIQSCAGLIYACPACRAEALPSASAAALTKVERKVDSLLGLFSPGSSVESMPDSPLGSDWPPLQEAGSYAASKRPPKRPSIPILSAAVEVALEKRDQKDCLVLSGVRDSGDDRKDFKCATNVLKHLKISSSPVRTFRMGSEGKKGQPKLLKVQLRSSHDRNQALRNTRELAKTEFSQVFVRPSLSAEERKRLKDLMKERWERNKHGDYCFIDWTSLSLKTSKKSPKHPDFVASNDPSNDSATDLFAVPTNGHPDSSATSNAASKDSVGTEKSGN